MADEFRKLVASAAARNPHASALLAPGLPTLTYDTLLARIDAMESALRDAGMGPRSRVATVLRNGPDAALAAIGLVASACSVPLNPGYGADELRFYLDDAGAEALIVESGDDGTAAQLAESMGLAVLALQPTRGGPAGHFDLQVRCARRALASDRAGRSPASLVLHTSGTTARPKIVTLTQAQLADSARSIAAHLRLSPDDRGLNVMPLFHIHGLVGSLFASLAAGASLVCTPGFDDTAFFEWVAASDPTWYTAVPTIHQAVLARAGDYRRVAPGHRFRFVRSSSAALPPAVFAALEKALEAPVVEAYGMTEAAHQMASNPLPPAPRKAGTVGIAAGTEIRVVDEHWNALPIGRVGEIAIRGDSVTDGYEANPEANAAAFRDGWFRTGDLGCFDADGYLSVVGRIKEIVNRGGEKISPREVDEALLEHPEVAQAVAFAVPHATLGEDLMAAVVRAPGARVDEQSLREHLFARLAGHKIPSGLVFVDQIPKGPTGKVQRTRLHEALAGNLVSAPASPLDETERLIADAIGAVLGSTGIGRHDNFFALGGDSLSGARVIARISDALGLEFQVAELFRHPSVAALAAKAREIADEEARLLAEIDAMSDDEVEALLARLDPLDRSLET
ncbi:MAG: non-ribosomal peptide synthetase [Burkholderiaceae bacterium]